MINHARTLLLNRAGGGQSLAGLGEEYIPEDFMAQELPPWLESGRQILFGSAPENTYANFQVARLLRTMHATEYEPYLRLHDPRLTYDPASEDTFSSAVYGMTWSFGNARVLDITRVGDPAADESRGRMRYVYSVSMVDAVATITHVATGRSAEADIHRSIGDPVSSIIEMPDAGFSVRFTMDSGVKTDWDTVGEIVALARPTRLLPDQIAAIDNLGGDFERRLFTDIQDEPYATFYSLWRQRVSLPERVAGLVLAMVYRLHRIYANRA